MKLIATVLFASLLSLVGCDSDEQTNTNHSGVKKSQLSGEFFTSATLVAKLSNSEFGFTGLQCPLERVRFEITQDKLLAYRSYDKGLNHKAASKQTLVSAFPIVAHIDSAGRADRPWHERDLVQVDWSRNLAPHVECNGWIESVTAVHVNTERSPDPQELYRVRMEDGYLETTIDALVEPDKSKCDALLEWSCQPSEYRVKFSFRRVDPNNDYEKKFYPDAETIRYGKDANGGICFSNDPGCIGNSELWLYSDHRTHGLCDPLKHNVADCYVPSVKMNSQFGFFRTDISEYDRKSGFSRGARHVINRVNLWHRSIDGHGRPIPLKERVPKAIVYYLNPGFPKDLLPAIRRIEREWNGAFLNVVAQLKNQCTVEGVLAFANHHQLMHLLHDAGMQEIDEYNLKDACALLANHSKNSAEGTHFFSGEISEIENNYGSMFVIKDNDCNEHHVNDYITRNGLGAVLSDHGINILTDDTIERACAVLEWEAQARALPEQFTWQRRGDIRYRFINAIAMPDGEGLLGYGPTNVDPQTGEIISGTANIYLPAITQYATRAAQLVFALEQRGDHSDTKDTFTHADHDINEFSAYVEKSVNAMTPSTYRASRSKEFQRHNFKAAVNVRAWAFTGFRAEEFVQDESVRDAHTVMHALLRRDFHLDMNQLAKKRLRDEFFSERSACFSHTADEIPYARFRSYAKTMSEEQLVRLIRSSVFESVTKHELGHTFGLRHNFNGAYDALNYPPTFWGVDTKDFRMRTGLSHEEMRSSSIMDYHKRFDSDFSGLGLYDYAALLAGYGDLVEVFDTRIDDFVPRSLVGMLDLMTYKDLPYVFAGKGAEQVIGRHIKRVKDDYLRGNRSAHVDIATLNLEKHPENLYKRRVVSFDTLKRQTFNESLFGDDALTQVPYRFCTDRQAGDVDISCHPFIYGSSASEIVESSIRDYELAREHQRVLGSTPKSVSSYLTHVYDRVYTPILRTYQTMYMMSNGVLKIYPAVYDLTVGAKRGLDFISRVLQAVEPGEYCKNTDGNYVKRHEQEICDGMITIDETVGKPYGSKQSDGLVGRHEKIGYVYDKILALLMLIDDGVTVNHDFSTWQPGTYSIGFYRLFTPQLLNVFSHLFTDQWSIIAPQIEVSEHNHAKILYRDLFSVSGNEPVKKPFIQPGYSSVLRDYAIVFSMAGLSNPLDHKLDFAKRAQIKRLGAQMPMTAMASDDNHVTFIDPESGIGYYAMAYEGKATSPGFMILKDAADFVADTSPQNEVMGPWRRAHHALMMASAHVASVQNDVNASAREHEEAQLALKRAQKNYDDTTLLLREKVRVIEQVWALSKEFVD